MDPLNNSVIDIDTSKVLEALIRITQERDQESLEIALLQTICKELACDFLKFYRVTQAHHDKKILQTAEISAEQNFEKNICHYQLITPSTDARRALRKQTIIQKDFSSYSVTYIPVRVKNRVIGLIEINSQAPLSSSDEQFIHSLMQIYPNFLSIVRDNESDSLTGLLNRKTFDEKISRIFHSISPTALSPHVSGEQRRESEGELHWLGVLDIDYFKEINDNFGHLYGDEVLILLANIMRDTFRETDLLYRYGGEEFVVVLSPCSAKAACAVFERLRDRVESYCFPQVGNVTISIGFVKFADQDYPSTVVNHADKALYYAKQHGRNRVCSYDELVATGKIRDIKFPSDIEIF